jgi:hypothetical protein
MQAFPGGSDAEKMAALRALMFGPAGILTLVIVVPILLAILYLIVRLSLFAVLAADYRRFDLARAWGLARGAMLALFVSTCVLLVIDLLIGAVLGGGAGFVAAATGHAGQGAAWGGVLGQTVSAAVNGPLFAGLALYVYRAQRGDEAVAATFA